MLKIVAHVFVKKYLFLMHALCFLQKNWFLFEMGLNSIILNSETNKFQKEYFVILLHLSLPGIVEGAVMCLYCTQSISHFLWYLDNAQEALKRANEVLKVVQGWTEEVLPNKKDVLGNLHSCLGN